MGLVISRFKCGWSIAASTVLAMVTLANPTPGSANSAEVLFGEHCAACHGADRLGGTGPALLPGNLRRLRKSRAADTIRDGLPATQMPAFGQTLTAAQIAEVAEFIYTPPKVPPQWGADEITGSRVVHRPDLLEKTVDTVEPAYDADPLNLFLVVEAGDHHVTVLDGDRFEAIHRFKSRHALHGGPKYSSSGRYVYLASRDGWISKFDMYRLEVIAEVRAGINTRNAAVSADDRYVLVGNYLPHTLVLLDAHDLSLVRVIPVVGRDGTTSRASAVYTAPPRDSFMIALKDVKEVWELNYSVSPPPGFGADWIHDYRKDSGDAKHEAFPIRRLAVDDYLDDFFFDQDYVHLIGSSRDGGTRVFDLDLKRVTHTLDLEGLPHLASGITWRWRDTTVLATPNIKSAEVTIIDMRDWRTIKKLKTAGPGFFMRSHENSRYAWVDVFFGEHRDKVHVIDKEKLEIVETLQPEPGKTSAHVEFTRGGEYALLSIWDPDGALVIYNGDTLAEVKRVPMKKPVGKYNVFNKITRSEGTSH